MNLYSVLDGKIWQQKYVQLCFVVLIIIKQMAH